MYIYILTRKTVLSVLVHLRQVNTAISWTQTWIAAMIGGLSPLMIIESQTRTSLFMYNTTNITNSDLA